MPGLIKALVKLLQIQALKEGQSGEKDIRDIYTIRWVFSTVVFISFYLNITFSVCVHTYVSAWVWVTYLWVCMCGNVYDCMWECVFVCAFTEAGG